MTLTPRQKFYKRHRKHENARSRAYHYANRTRLCIAMSERRFKQLYGITIADKTALLASQNFLCAGCGSSDPGGRWGWQIDHNHMTGKIRGVLCHYCNLTLGNAKEDVSRLAALITYLEKHK